MARDQKSDDGGQIMIVRNDHIGSTSHQMLAFETIDAPVLMHFIAGDANCKAADAFDWVTSIN